MKVLLIGMDGAHRAAFDRGWTPFISNLLKSHQDLNLTTDLISRGWAEIVFGKHAKKTNALYDYPLANGSHDWTKKFGLSSVPKIGTEIKGIWQELNEKGFSVGIMNVPTTFPAPKVNGFIVSGGGGGAPVVDKPTEDLCFPKEILPTLIEKDYIVDDRLYQLVVEKNINTSTKIFDRLSYMNQRRTDAFLTLDKQFKVDFGFIVFKTSSVIAESILSAENVRRKNKNNLYDEAAIVAIRKYYENFDLEIKRLKEAYPETEFIFVSDHGTTEVTHCVNPNILLQQAGLQQLSSNKRFLKRIIFKFIQKTPFWIKYFLKKRLSNKIQTINSIGFNKSSTTAFCKAVENWNHGIFINDNKRFGGPVEEKDIDSIRERIVSLINSNSMVKKHGIYAKKSDNKLTSSFRSYPDIELFLPNGYLTNDNSSEFISELNPTLSESSLKTIMRGDILSMKTHNPIAMMSKKAFLKSNSQKLEGNLTDVYHRTIEMFND